MRQNKQLITVYNFSCCYHKYRIEKESVNENQINQSIAISSDSLLFHLGGVKITYVLL